MIRYRGPWMFTSVTLYLAAVAIQVFWKVKVALWCSSVLATLALVVFTALWLGVLRLRNLGNASAAEDATHEMKVLSICLLAAWAVSALFL